MTLHISAEVEQLARLVAAKTGKALDDIVKEAIEARALASGVAVIKQRRPPDEIERRIKEIAKRAAALPILDNRSADEIIGYNEHGVPE